MQQPASIPPFFIQSGIHDPSGGTVTHSWGYPPDTTKTAAQYHQWENNGAGHYVTGGNNYGPGGAGGGAQTRVGPQQPPQPSQPTPTSTPPGGIHGGDMANKPLLNQPTQVSFVQRGIAPTNFSYPQGGRQPARPIHQSRQLYQMPISQTLVAQSPQAIMQAAVGGQPQQIFMYNPQPRQPGPYNPTLFAMQQSFHPNNYPQQYYQPQVLPQAAYSGITSGGPSPQAPVQQPQVALMRPTMVPTPQQPPPTKSEPRKQRPNALKIFNPDTMEEVVLVNEVGSNNNNVTPTRSNDSSARETPQPNGSAPSSVVDNTVAAEFAAKVAACALDTQPSSASEAAISDSSETVHKQQSNVVLSEKVTSKLSTNSEEFVPRSHKVSEPPPPLLELVPTVSADTDAPAVDPYVQLKMPAPISQSPMRTVKKKGIEQPAPVQPPIVVETKEKKEPKKEELVEVSQPPPKERREKTRSRSKEQSPAPSPVDSAAKSSAEETPHNGETEVPLPPAPVTVPPPPVSAPPHGFAGDGKTTRQKGKKSASKMRKGVEKEGSEMDAFTSEPSIMSEEKERPVTPVSPPPSTTPPAEPEPFIVDKIKEDLEEKENKLVAEKNEENVKVSSLAKEEEETTAPVIEKTRPQLTLRHSYSKDQWSPLNPEGKKKYDRDFLITLKQEPQSLLKPDGLPDVVAVVRDISNNNNMRNPGMMPYRQDTNNVVIPSFMRSQSQRGQMVPKRGSQQGNKNNKSNPKVLHLTLSLHEDVKLKTTENAWKPDRLQADFNKSEEEKQTEELYKKVRGILNKLTPQKFDTLMAKFMSLPINTEERLTGVINLIFEKAVDEPSFSKAYANMCKLCSRLEVIKQVDEKVEKVNFRKILITRCQTEFESNKSAELDSAKWQEEINNCADPEKKKELQLQYEEKERQLRMKSVGNIRFIGELFKLNMLTPAIMHRCIEHLLNTPEEESLECLCKLLTTIGKDLENSQHSNQKPSLNPYFQRMQDLAQKKAGSKVSSRVRFMLQDVIELRKNKWVPRREDNNPKTIEQINKEVERENFESTMALNQPQQRNNRPNDQRDDRKRRNNTDTDGWATVTSNSRHFNSSTRATAFESSKMMSAKHDMMDLNNTSLGGSQMFRFNTKAMEPKSGPPSFTSNTFSALSRGEERKPPQSMNNRRMTPTPSIERDKERQRMLQGAVENDGRSSRGSSAQRERPQAPSRDNSIPRQTPAEDKGSRRSEEDIRKAEEKLERQTNTLFEEYLSNVSTVDDIRQEVEQLYVGDKVEYFVEKALSMCLEKKAPAQRNVGLLLTSLMDSNLFSADVLTKQFGFLYETADDIAIDIPKFWELQANILVPIIGAEKITFSHFKAACQSVLKTKAASKLLVPVLNLLATEKGAGFVRKVWDSSSVSLKDFLPGEVNVDDFMKENSLGYLTGDAPKYEANLSMDQVQEKILRLLQNNQPFEKILEFISSNVADKVEDIQFIRALVIAICEACISAPKYSLDIAKFKQYERLIQRFVDNKEDRELACLSSVHILLCRLQHPQGLIMQIFNHFLDSNLISPETFLKWKDDEHEKLENKGVSVMSLGSFFSALEDTVLGEADSDNDNS